MNSLSPQRQPKILVAEDDEYDFFYLQSILGNAGIASIYHVKDGAQTVAYLQGTDRYKDRAAYPFPDILLLDLKLPKVSGHEILEWLQTKTGLRKPRIYVLSASNEKADRTRASRAGANDYFVKPIRLGHLAILFEGVQMEEWEFARERALP